VARTGAIDGLNLPETDRKVIWPLIRRHEPTLPRQVPGFFAVHIDCTGARMRWAVEQQAPPRGR